MAEDFIALRGMVFYGFHGNRPEEQALGQRFVIDVVLTMDLSAAGASDVSINLKLFTRSQLLAEIHTAF